jgi:hypothetical protein
MIYCAEAWTLRRKEKEVHKRRKTRVWILGVTLKDRKRSEDVRRTVGVANIQDKVTTDKIADVRTRQEKRREFLYKENYGSKRACMDTCR